ncbi:MAG TPA: tetratricopeptide repeat protein [Flavipsychrobacter sp.]|nr:tetratricopeptide repeat protein [Flavipsychrobacter sp.]
MITRLLLVAAILFFNINADASPHDKWWEAGNRFYSQKQYDSAAFYFEKIAALKPDDAAVYYNLGNTYYRLNKVGLAVLNYERALRISPNHKEANDNLVLTQSRIPNRVLQVQDIFFVRWWKSLTAPATTTFWSVLSLVLFLGIIGISLMKVLGKMQLPGKVTASLGVLWVIALMLAFSSTRNKTEAAVIMQNGTSLMSSSKQGKIIGTLPEGTTVDIEKEDQMMAEISLTDGRKGWVEKTALSKI